jgi:hypothetical protein
MQQVGFRNHMVFDPIGSRTLLPLFDEDRVRATLTGLLICRNKDIRARRNAAGELNRAEVAGRCGRCMVEGLERAPGLAWRQVGVADARHQHEVGWQQRDMRWRRRLRACRSQQEGGCDEGSPD